MRGLPALGVICCLLLCAWALLKGFYIEPTTQALARSAQGQRMALLAVPGLVMGIAGLVRARWGLAAGALSLLLALGALLIAVV